MDKIPMFSIIIVTLNAEKEINITLDSIERQNYKDYEVIVKDGGSKDVSMYKIPRDDKYCVYILKDRGVYDGMNQALEYVKGRFLIFLNAGDYFYDENVLFKIAQYIKDNGLENEICVLYGNYNREDEYIQYQPYSLTSFYLYRRPLCHQSMFYNKSVFLENGKYDLHFSISADHDFNMKLWNKGICFWHTGITICNYKGGGISESDSGVKKALQERNEIRKKYYSPIKCFKYNIIICISFSRLRAWLDSENSPRNLNKLYVLLRNTIFKYTGNKTRR